MELPEDVVLHQRGRCSSTEPRSMRKTAAVTSRSIMQPREQMEKWYVFY